MTNIKIGTVDINSMDIVRRVRDEVDQLVQNPTSYYSLRFKPPYYFETLGGQPPSEKGWYIILDDRYSVYTGKADDLNSRLNSYDGCRDNFGNPTRTSDSVRNLIRKFYELQFFPNLRVCVVKESDLCLSLGINSSELTELDRNNIEKLIDIFRAYFNYT